MAFRFLKRLTIENGKQGQDLILTFRLIIFTYLPGDDLWTISPLDRTHS